MITKKQVDFFLKKVNEDDINELIDEVIKNPFFHQHPIVQIKKFFSNFVNSAEMILNVFSKSTNKRIAIAVLLDKVQNIQNTASLEILFIDKSVSSIQQEKILSFIIESAIRLLPKHRSGFDLLLSEKVNLNTDYLIKNGLNLNYSFYKMERALRNFVNNEKEKNISDQKFIVELAHNTELKDIYNIVCETFKNNIEVSIPEEQIWIDSQKDPHKKLFVLRYDGKIIAFVNLIYSHDSKTAEINSIGVLNEFRGLGVGKKLIEFSLNSLKNDKIYQCQLSVALENKNALQLYLNLGFQKKAKWNVYQYIDSLSI